MKYYYVDGITSSGKSIILRKVASENAETGLNTIIALPTIALIEEYKARFASDHPETVIEAFYTDDERAEKSGSIAVDVKNAIEITVKGDGRTILITHHTLVAIKLMLFFSDWHVLIDEELLVFKGHELNVSNSHRLVTDHLSATPIGPKYAQIGILDRDAIKTVVDNREDDITWAPFKDLCRDIISPWSQCYTILQTYENLLKSKGKKRKLIMFSVLDAKVLEQFETVTIFCARFTETLNYKIWEKQGVEWQRDADLCQELRIHAHEGYESLKIY